MHADSAHPRFEERLTTVGIARTGVEVRVVDDEDRELPPGEVGEVIARSDLCMSGYYNNPEASAVTLRGGWLHTGDLGSIDAEGFLTLKDRSKDLIISGGTNIYPREVEEALLIHPGVLECSVIGRRHPDWGRRGHRLRRCPARREAKRDRSSIGSASTTSPASSDRRRTSSSMPCRKAPTEKS